MVRFLTLKRPGNRRKYKVISEIFLNETADSFYLLGVYMTDGWLHNLKVGLSSKDKDWLAIIRDNICPGKPVYRKKKGTITELVINDIDVSNWLISYGCTPRKSLTLSLKKKIPSEYYPDFIRGMIDGDGCITIYTNKGKSNLTVYLCSASKRIIDQVEIMIPNHIVCHQYVRPLSRKKRSLNGQTVIERHPQHKLNFTGVMAQKILEWLYYPGHLFSMPRKLKRAKKAIDLRLVSRPYRLHR